MRIETTDGKRIVVTTDADAEQLATYRFELALPDGSKLEVAGTLVANAHGARDDCRAAADTLLDRMVEAGWFPGGLRQVDASAVGDAFTMELGLCDSAGITHLDVLNRLRRLGGHEEFRGEPFSCTGSAHLGGEHIRCTSEAHRAAPATAAPFGFATGGLVSRSGFTAPSTIGAGTATA